MTTWKFADVPLRVSTDTPPSSSGGYEKIILRPPGVDKPIMIDDRRALTVYTLVVNVKSVEHLVMLTALAQSGVEADLEVPRGNDAWVYEDSSIGRDVTTEEVIPGALWRVTLEITAGDPRPLWKSSGERVF